MYFFLFILCVVSVSGRVAVSEHNDIISNLIVHNKSVESKQNLDINTNERVETLDNSVVTSLTVHPTPTEAPAKPKYNDLIIRTLASLKNNSTIKLNPLDEIKVPESKSDSGKALLLTEYIKDGRIKEARTACKVDSSIFLGFKSYSGFFTVNETYNSNIFFWYFPVLDKPVSETPWIIWLQGGPGASSLIGLFDEMGPFFVVNDSLKLNPHTWLQNHSLVFIDSPVGTGFSFTDHDDGYATDMATYATHLYRTLKQFLQIFPELRTAPLYLAGESYAGKYIPAMAMEIHKRNQGNENTDINLQGLILGNAFMDPAMISNVPWPFYYFGLLDREQLENVKPLVDSLQQAIKENKSVKAKNKWMNLITLLLFLTNQKHAYNFLRDEIPVGRFLNFLRTTEVRKALHVADINFGFVNLTVNSKLAPDFLSTTKPLVERLLEHYKVLAYCGQLDQMIPCVVTSENYRTWKWNGTDEFIKANRFPYIYDNKLAGYHKTGGRFTEVVIRGAGHMVPVDTPAPIQNLITRWTHGMPLSLRYGMLSDSFVQDFIANNSLTTYL